MLAGNYYEDVSAWIQRELNFFRIHLLFFLFAPLISAAIFWGANGRFHIAFIDALFLCYSALTVTGLSTVDLSTLTVFQQAILFVLMLMGNVTVVAWVMVLIRKRYFRQHLEDLHQQEKVKQGIKDRLLPYINRIPGIQIGYTGQPKPEIVLNGGTTAASATPSTMDSNRGDGYPIRAEGGIGAALVGGGSANIGLGVIFGAQSELNGHQGNLRVDTVQSTIFSTDAPSHESPKSITHSFEVVSPEGERGIVADVHSFTSSPRSGAAPLPMSPTSGRQSPRVYFPFSDPDRPQLRHRPGVPAPRRRQTVFRPPLIYDQDHLGQRGKDQGLGGFPGPLQLFHKFSKRFFPRLDEFLHSLVMRPVNGGKKSGKSMKWLTDEFSNLIIGRNSDFNTEELTDEELEKLGGIEYRALRALSYIVFFYFVGTQLVTLTLIAPWLSVTHKYDDVFNSQPRLVNKSWFTIFQIVGAYTGGGMSLVDAGMVPFQQAYLMIFSLIFAILAGNHGLPIFLRLTIWILTKFVKDNSVADQTLHFLLDHPRRCFLYLFPSHVTWFLVATLVVFTAIEWASFIVLDLGLSVIESLPAGAQVVAGLFQSFAVRASGFAIVPLSSLAPSFQFLCVIMMYIAIYPVALSIRSTNVYEENSLGVFQLPEENEEEEPNMTEKTGTRRERIGKYFGWHLRRQVAYDIWWLVCGIFLICIIERTKIMDDDNAPWFNIFRIVFELVSAFGGIGLSLGVPYDNFSFCGSFGPLSKLVVIVIMVRGRHRGLPVAVDRAILLPQDLVPAKEGDTHSQVTQTPVNPVDAFDEVEKGQPPHITSVPA